MNKRIISTTGAPKAIATYSQAVEVNGTLYISGQIAINSAVGTVVEGGIKEQTHQVMKNIGAILQEAGYQYSDIVKCTCLLQDMSMYKDMNEVYGSYFPENPPARAAFAVKGLPMDVMVEIDAVAVK